MVLDLVFGNISLSEQRLEGEEGHGSFSKKYRPKITKKMEKLS
jgi:hypothetical protein